MTDAEYDHFLERGNRWRELLPEGRYAWPLHDWANRKADDHEVPPLIGHLVYWKRRHGRLTVFAQATSPEHNASLSANWRADENMTDRRYLLASFVEDPARYAGVWGMHSGNCGFCGRALTDPHSREIGIGPECAKKVNR